MKNDAPERTELIDWLRQRGHTPTEIDKILTKLDQYDEQTIRQSIFDSIDDGTFDIVAVIEEALADKK